MFYLPQERENIDFREFDYVIDAIDTLTAKVDLALACLEANVPLISALGCGNRLDPKKLIVTDIFKTEGDPLAKAFRKALREKGIKKLKVVYSTEQPLKPINQLEDEVMKRHSP
jgi:tRNA A37 threonylcarbamoyladenosine dehydratase